MMVQMIQIMNQMTQMVFASLPFHIINPSKQNHKLLNNSLLLLVIAENNPLNDYPDEISEEDEEEVEDSESESEGENGDASNESSNEDTEHHGFSKDYADPYDEDFDEYEGVCNYDEDGGDEDWRWSYR